MRRFTYLLGALFLLSGLTLARLSAEPQKGKRDSEKRDTNVTRSHTAPQAESTPSSQAQGANAQPTWSNSNRPNAAAHAGQMQYYSRQGSNNDKANYNYESPGSSSSKSYDYSNNKRNADRPAVVTPPSTPNRAYGGNSQNYGFGGNGGQNYSGNAPDRSYDNRDNRSYDSGISRDSNRPSIVIPAIRPNPDSNNHNYGPNRASDGTANQDNRRPSIVIPATRPNSDNRDYSYGHSGTPTRGIDHKKDGGGRDQANGGWQDRNYNYSRNNSRRYGDQGVVRTHPWQDRAYEWSRVDNHNSHGWLFNGLRWSYDGHRWNNDDRRRWDNDWRFDVKLGHRFWYGHPYGPVFVLPPLGPWFWGRDYSDSYGYLAPQYFGCVAPLEGAEIYAADGTFLGIIDRDASSPLSLTNRFSAVGDPRSPYSLLNPDSQYGALDSALSPWCPNTSTPPRVFWHGQFQGYLTTNLYLTPRIDPYWLVNAYLRIRCW